MIDAAKQFLCEPSHLWLVIATLLLALVAGGKLGVFIRGLIKPGKGGNNVNLKIVEKGGDMGERKGEVYCPDPSKCPAHAEEKARSLQNQKEIEGMRADFHNYKEIFFKELAFIKQQNNVMLRAMVKDGQLAESDIPKEPL